MIQANMWPPVSDMSDFLLIQGHLLLDSPMTGGAESITENWILDYYKYWPQNFSGAAIQCSARYLVKAKGKCS